MRNIYLAYLLDILSFYSCNPQCIWKAHNQYTFDDELKERTLIITVGFRRNQTLKSVAEEECLHRLL